MRKVCCLLLFLGLPLFALAQNVAYVNGKPINSKEFMWVYKKNHNGAAHVSYSDLASYLELYINFKLKVIDARAIGMDADTAYKAEINSYEQTLKAQKKTSQKNPEYNFIMNEYREGVLMFNISEKKIWSKTTDNEDNVRAYYQQHAAAYEGKDYDEIRGQLISDYQQYLENEWIKLLRTKYTVKVNEDELKKLARL